jgi:hypothetical protein
MTAEGFRNEDAMVNIGAGFERATVPWPQIRRDGPDDFSGLGQSAPPSVEDGVASDAPVGTLALGGPGSEAPDSAARRWPSA